jgi:hydroxymethylpyrimidine pyrophosphatase-like HAD family hydrolase
MEKYVIAIDLHGTLFDEYWEIIPAYQASIINLIYDLRDAALFYLCTGNDLSFVKRYVPDFIMNHVQGCVLESGCIIYDFQETVYLTDAECRKKAETLQAYFRERHYPFVKSFGERKTTISLFTRGESGGEPPERYLDTVYRDLMSHPYKDDFYITFSDVAIDIIPVGFSKWKAIKNIAKSNTIISLMDSYNDKEIALSSDYTIMPKNVSPQLIDYLKMHQKIIMPLGKFHFFRNIAYTTDVCYTQAVIEGLRHIQKWHRQCRINRRRNRGRKR